MTADRLTEIIRPLKLLASRRCPRRAAVPSHALRSIELREIVEAELRPYIEALSDEFPGLHVVHRLYGGAWVTRLSLEGTRAPWQGRARGPSSNRMTFAVEVDPSADEVTLTSRASVFDRDLTSRRVTVSVDDPGQAELRECIEAACLAFARAYVVAAGRERSLR